MLNRLHETISAVCPIVGVALDDQGVVRIDFRDEATSQQRASANSVVAAFDWSDAAHQQWLTDREPEKRDLVAAAAQAVSDNDTFLEIASPTNAQTLAQVRRLTNQNNRIIRMLVRLATNG